MKSTLKLLYVIALLCFSASVVSNEASDLKTKLAKIPQFNAHFVQTVVDVEGIELQRNSGTMLLKQPNLLRWEVTEPNESVLVADGETVWYFDPFVEQVTAYSQQEMSKSTPVLLLAQPYSELWNDYQVAKIDQRYVLSANQNDQAQVQSLSISFNENDVLKQLNIVDLQGNNSTFLFDHVDAENPLPEDSFSFEIPVGFDLDDQR